MEVHHLVLKRLNGLVFRQDFLRGPGPVPQIGWMVEVSVSGSIRVPARVSMVETSATLPRADPAACRDERIIHAQELLYVPVAVNDP